MSDRAQITSTEAIDSFRASLVTYLESARPTLDEISSEVMRVRLWLEEDRLRFWERETHRRHRLLREAEDALRSAKMSQLREVTDAEVMAVRKAKAAFEEASERLRRVNRWRREFDSRIAPLAHQLDSLRNIFTLEMPRAVASLTNTLELLADYTGHSPTAEKAPPATEEKRPADAPRSPGGAL